MTCKTRISFLLACLLLTAAPAAWAQPAIKKVVTDADFDCPKPFRPNGSECTVDAATLKGLDTAACKGPGLAFVGAPPSAPSCQFDATQAPQPTCIKGSAVAAFDPELKRCVAKDDTPRSASGNYVGDCFTLVAEPNPNTLGFKTGEKFVVLSQREDGDDKVLAVAKASRTSLGPVPLPYFCSTQGPELKRLRASELNASGAERLGWTYGVLALPFKYYPGDRSFGSGVSLGPYVGRRSGAAGSAITFAATAAAGSVKGEVKDAAGNITGTPDLLAFSVALGWMFDISKAPGTKPFKIGLFIGQDRVSSDKAVSYKLNGKTWVAFQIGFDFTDN